MNQNAVKLRKNVKFIAIVLGILMLLSAVSGCSDATTAEESALPEPAETASAVPTQQTAEASAAEEPQGDTITVTDHSGNEVVLPQEINRVVVTSIYPMPAALSMFLGSAEKLVGIHPVSMAAAQNSVLSKVFPEILNASTGFVQGSDINMEELMKLDPDVVIYSAGNKAEEELYKNTGIPAVGISATNWDYDVIKTYDEWINILGQMFPDHDKSQVVSDYSREIYDFVQERVKDIPEEERTRALFLFTYDETAIMTSGKHFFGQYWADASGAVNVAGVLDTEQSVEINMEQIYEWDPDVIYITNFTPAQPEDLYTNNIGGDDWSQVKAVKDERVYKMPLGSYRSYTPGIDTPLTLLWVAKTMYPDQFADIDMTQKVKEYYSQIFGIELTDEDVSKMYTPSSDAGNIKLS
jgi:iron complex transport system substrate-binding protein